MTTIQVIRILRHVRKEAFCVILQFSEPRHAEMQVQASEQRETIGFSYEWTLLRNILRNGSGYSTHSESFLEHRSLQPYPYAPCHLQPCIMGRAEWVAAYSHLFPAGSTAFQSPGLESFAVVSVLLEFRINVHVRRVRKRQFTLIKLRLSSEHLRFPWGQTDDPFQIQRLQGGDSVCLVVLFARFFCIGRRLKLALVELVTENNIVHNSVPG